MADSKVEPKKYVVSNRVKHSLRFDGATYAVGEMIDLSKVDANQVKACVASGLLVEFVAPVAAQAAQTADKK